MATLFVCASLTPSLLPRTWQFQGVMGGITGIIGYGVGASAGAMGRAVIPYRPPERARQIIWRAMIAGCGTLTALALSYSIDWQLALRAQMGMDTQITWFPPLILGLAASLFVLFLLISRLVRLGGRKLIDWLDRFVPFYVGHAIGVLIVTLVVALFANDVVYSGFVTAMGDVSSVTNDTTAPGVRQPVSPDMSGGPGSLVTWDSLGKEGRTFTGTAPTVPQLSAFSGKPASRPIRVYVGLDTAATPQAQAALAVRELERTGAFDRPVLAVLGTTGTGWVDPSIARSLEYMYNGASALVALQYSYLPSWVSFLVDRDKAAATGRALFDAVRAKWATLPEAHRPRLLISGESLGTYELEGAFDGLSDMAARSDGALFVGPPDANPIWNALTRGREPGSPVWRPVYQNGETARFAQYPGDLARPPDPWPYPRVVYLQNASDPVVWWSPKLLWHKPTWLAAPRAPDINPQMNWFPLVTFWQVLVDMTAAQSVPTGHGHRYGANIVDGWAALTAPPGWSPADTDKLRLLLSGGS